MREIVAPPKKKALWLNQLSDKQLAEVYFRLKKFKQPIYDIVKNIIQDEWGIMVSSSVKSLSRAVYAFRDKLVTSVDLQYYPLAGESPALTREKREALAALGRKGKRILKKLDLVKTFQWVLSEQVERIAALREQEIVSGNLSKQTEAAMQTFTNMAEKLGNINFKLGLWESKPSEFNLNIKHQMDNIFTKVLTNNGAPMLEATNKFLENLNSECITLEADEKGTFSIKDKEGEVVHYETNED